jgi:cytochrome c-type biogenesis protein CcmH/NrfG
MNLLRLKPLFFVLILLLAMQSCAEMKSRVSPKSPVKTSSHVKRTPQVSSQEPAQGTTLARQYMEAGEYQKAIDIYSAECRKQPQNPSLMKEYAKALNGIKSTADKALEKRDFASAGRMYYVLQNNYAKFSDVDQMLSFNSAYLNTKLSYCKKSLSIQGFQEYRKGHLNEAIVLWQSLLVIDPNNEDIKVSVKTAKQQQENLKEKSSP